jgi:hypothetical protein
MSGRPCRAGTATAARPRVFLDPVAEGMWRVLDYGEGTTGVDVLVGFVQRTTNAYSVTVLSRPSEQQLCHSLLGVQELFGARHELQRRPLSVPHAG